jgi:hypothetical protein
MKNYDFKWDVLFPSIGFCLFICFEAFQVSLICLVSKFIAGGNEDLFLLTTMMLLSMVFVITSFAAIPKIADLSEYLCDRLGDSY